jgi:hypothetical protein
MKASSKRSGWGIAALALGLGGTLATACGDDGGGGGGSGVSGAKTVDDVTDADAKKICMWTYEQTQNVSFSDRDLCEIGAKQLSSSASECKELVDTCLKDPPELDADDEGPECDDAMVEDLPAACSKVTVHDYESCIQGIFAAWKKAFVSVSCTSSGDIPTLADAAGDLPSSCDTIVEHCPEMLPSDLFDDSDDSVPVKR